MQRIRTVYVCPETHQRLYRSIGRKPRVSDGLETKSGNRYPLDHDVPNLTFPKDLCATDQKVKSFYDSRAEAYDKYLHLTFKTHNEDEAKARNSFVDLLEVKKGGRVLEIACGTGRDSEIIAERLGDGGELFLMDISPLMLARCAQRLKGHRLMQEFCIANAAYLPLEDRYFDAVYSFGGLGEFSDITRSLSEMARVTKVGGKIVVGDESIPPWLRNTEFAKVLSTTNPQFQAEVPLAEMPIEAREVCLRWVIGGVFYLIDFRVGKGEPIGNFDFEIPGPRGGTYRTRYEGQLEGVSKEAKRLAHQAIQKKGISMHKWLDAIVRAAAHRDLGDK